MARSYSQGVWVFFGAVHLPGADKQHCWTLVRAGDCFFIAHTW